jgi:HTH-type transcriptional regulator/antitoxin HigA
MDLPIITSDDEYRSYLAELENLVPQDPDPASPEAQRLDWLARVIEGFERRRFPFGRPEVPPRLTGQAPSWKCQTRSLIALNGIRISDLIIAGRGT